MLTSVPPSLVSVLKEKLANQVFDSGSAFSLCIDEGSPQGHRVSLLTNHALAKQSDIFLCDHLLTFAAAAPDAGDADDNEGPEAAALRLLQQGGESLQARMHALLEMDEEEEDAETAAAEDTVQRMWPLVGSYSLPDKQHPEQSRKFFFVMDEVGSRFCEVFPRRSMGLEKEEESSTSLSNKGAGFHCALVFHPTTGEAFTAFWPRREVEEGEIATCDNLPHGQAARLARLQVLEEERFSGKNNEEEEVEEEEEEDQDIKHTLHRLRDFLLTNNYTVECVNTLLGLKETCGQLLPVWDISEPRLRETFVKQMESQKTSSSPPLLVLLVKFFLMGMAVSRNALLSGVRDRALLRGLEKLGLLFVEGDDDDENNTHTSVKSLVQLTPVPVPGAGGKTKRSTAAAATAIVATDFAQVGSGSGGFDPVMYVGPDSLGLVAAVPPPAPPSPPPSQPRARPRRGILDLCSGCGVQGIVAALASSSSPLEELTMVELNPRAARFARFNVVINGLDPTTVKVLEKDVRALLPTQKPTHTTTTTKATEESPSPTPLSSPSSSLLSPTYNLILCNPPYIANPGKQARNLHGYGDGGATGEEVTEAVVELASQLLQNENEEGAGGWLYLVGNLVNVDTLPVRVEKWWSRGTSSAAAGAHIHTHLPQIKVFHGKKWSTGEYAAIIHNHRIEETSMALRKDPVVSKYKEALDVTGVTDVSNGFLFLHAQALPEKKKKESEEEEEAESLSVSVSVSGAAAAVVVPLHEQLWQVLAMHRYPEAKEARERMREGWL